LKQQFIRIIRDLGIEVHGTRVLIDRLSAEERYYNIEKFLDLMTQLGPVGRIRGDEVLTKFD